MEATIFKLGSILIDTVAELCSNAMQVTFLHFFAGRKLLLTTVAIYPNISDDELQFIITHISRELSNQEIYYCPSPNIYYYFTCS